MRQDIHRHFDSIAFDQAIGLLKHLNAPDKFTRLLAAFYAQGSRIFAAGPYQGDAWQHGFVRRVPQGCPLSPFLGAAVMPQWLYQVRLPGIGEAVYMDDRVLWVMRIKTSLGMGSNSLERGGKRIPWRSGAC